MVYVLIWFIVWCLLVIISSMRFSVVPRYSNQERARLQKQGDRLATEEARQLFEAPLLMSLQQIIRTVLTAALMVSGMVMYGIVPGAVYGTLGLLFVPLVFRLSLVVRLSDRFRDMSMPWLRKTAEALRPVLKWLRDRDSAVLEATLNSKEELLSLVERSPGVLSREERLRLEANLAFDDRTVGDIMTPRSVIDAVPVGETLGPLVLDELYKTGHSRFPVFKSDLDHVVGMLYLHDLIDLKNGSQPAKEAMQSKVYFIRDDRDLSHALHGFLSTRHHLFIVVNKYRETVGLLSLEDTMEALLGVKITDEFDAFDDLRAVAEHNPHDNNEPKGMENI